MRGSDPDAALYWLVTLLESGESPRFLARRLVILASEDVGLADPTGLVVADAAARAVEFVGLPEARLTLAHATVHLALAPKSNSVTRALGAVTRAVRRAGSPRCPTTCATRTTRARPSWASAPTTCTPTTIDGGWVDQQYLPDAWSRRDVLRPEPPTVASGAVSRGDQSRASARLADSSPSSSRSSAPDGRRRPRGLSVTPVGWTGWKPRNSARFSWTTSPTNGHTVVPSASLIPHDPSLLFTVAGMVPFKPYFLGEEPPPSPRAVSIQKCFRAPDIDIIGTTQRHLTFFEMMGNFSFGDYFKEGAIRYAWGLITEGFGLDPERLWVTVHTRDDQADELWRDVDRRARPSASSASTRTTSGTWARPDRAGRARRSSSTRAPAFGADGGPAPGGEDRFIEFWNLVFMQYEKRTPAARWWTCPSKNIDTGAGFERVLSILNGVESVFATDLFAPLLETASRAVDAPYGRDEATDVAIRRIAEHGRAMTMLVADGVLPSNEGRGYVLRRIIRRAILAARRAGSEAPLVASLVDATIEKMGDAYPVLVKDRDLIVEVLEREEAGFARTLRTGLSPARGGPRRGRRGEAHGLPGRRRLQPARHPRLSRSSSPRRSSASRG